MKKIFILVLLLTVFVECNTLAGEPSFNLDTSLPITKLDDSCQLTLLNSRLGSRFSLTFASGDKGMHTGALGFDFDEFSEMLIQVEVQGERSCFRTANLPSGSKYFKNQIMRFGMTSMQLEGQSPEGLKVTVTIVSPFTPSASLTETKKIQTQTAPVFYILIDVKNASGSRVDGKIKLGFNKIAYNRDLLCSQPSWKFGNKTNQVFFRDVAAENTLLGLVAFAGPSRHFKQGAFHGLAKDFSLQPNGSFKDTLIYAAYHEGKVQFDKKTNMPLRFYYTRFWKNIDEVIAYAKTEASRNIELSQRFENILQRSNASPAEKWVTALSFHTDLANSFFLLDEKDRPRFYVLEGRFRHQSTIDVAHETELTAVFTPWRLKIQLEQWLDYMARQEVNLGRRLTSRGWELQKEGMGASEYGPFLFHDVGNVPFVAETSEYGYGPHMAVEENSTYTLLLYWYWKLTGDDTFVQSKLGMLDILLHSLTNRDSDDSGIADVGIGWSTYDVNDAINRSPENVYLGVKQMCAYVAGAEMFSALAVADSAETTLESMFKDMIGGDEPEFIFEKIRPNKILRQKQSKRYLAEAEKIEKSLKSAYEKYGYVPVSLDKTFRGWNQLSVVAGEGLLLMCLGGSASPILKRCAGFLGDSYRKAFDKSKTPYGIKLSSKEGVTWFSKVMVSDIVASYWYGQNQSTADYVYQWNKNNPNAYNDGALDAHKDWTGYWYPRGISSLGYLFRENKFTARDLKTFLKGL